MTFLRYFFYIVGAALLASLLGGLFASVVALISPEFVRGLFYPPADASIVRYAAGVGMIWGIFLGTAAMGFCLLLVTLISIARIIRKKSDAENAS